MARRRFAVVHGQSRGPKRGTQWLGSATDTAVTTLGPGTAVLDQSFAFGEPATIVRTRGLLSVAPDQVTGTEFPFGALGMAVVTDQATAAGVASMPTPITESDADSWFVWEAFAASILLSTGAAFTTDAMQHFPFDSKAMRKVDDNSTAVVVLENSSAAAGLRFLITFRMLVMLHG